MSARLPLAIVSVAALLLLAAACDTVPVPPPTPVPTAVGGTLWGQPAALASAPSIDVPALTAVGASSTLAAFELEGGTPTLILYRDGVRHHTGVTAVRPYDLIVLPMPAAGTLALWLDDDSAGSQTLFSARLDAGATSERGPVPVSAGAVTRYTAAAAPDGSVWAVWSAPNAGEPSLLASRIDALGRARSPQLLRVDADYPALAVTAAGNALLFWLDGDRLDLQRAELTNAGLTRVVALASAPWPRQPADQLIRFDVGLDRTHAYAFWQVRGAAGDTEVWHTSGALAAQSISPASVLRIAVTSEPAQTGFNHGVAYGASADPAAPPVSWALPAAGQNETLPVSAAFDGALGVVYFKDGAVVARQTLGSLARELVAAPRLAIDDNRDLIVAWWLPETIGTATLYVVHSGRR